MKFKTAYVCYDQLSDKLFLCWKVKRHEMDIYTFDDDDTSPESRYWIVTYSTLPENCIVIEEL
jgi:hypothetical protein